MEEANKRIIKNTLYLYVRSFMMVIIGLFSSRVILQALGIEDYGLYGAIGSIVSMFVIINGVLTAGSSRFLTFEIGQGNAERLAMTFSASFTLHLSLAFILFAALETIGLWFLNAKMAIPDGRLFAANIVYQLSILDCMLSLTQVPYGAIITAHERMNIVAWVGLLEAIFKLALIFILLYIPFADNLIAYALIITFWSIGLQMWYRFYCVRHFPECRLRIVRNKDIYKGMLSYSIWDFIGQFCATGNTQGVNILINIFFGVTVNAARAVAYQVENTIAQFVNNFMVAVQPQIIKSYAQNDLKHFFQLIFNSGKYSYFLLFLFSLPIFLEADYILSLWLVEVPNQAPLFLRWVIIIALANTIIRPVINGVHATGDVKTLNLTSGVYASLTFLPVIYLLYKLGQPAWYCFVVELVNCVICSVLRIRALYKNVRFNILDFVLKVYVQSVGISLIASIVPVVVVITMETGFARLIITCISSFFLTSLCIYHFGLFSYQRASVKALIKEKVLNITSRKS